VVDAEHLERVVRVFHFRVNIKQEFEFKNYK